MVDKQKALEILEEIKADLNKDDRGIRAQKDIDIYIKDLKLATDPNIKKLVEQQKQYMVKYGEDDPRTIKLNRKISKKIDKVFNNK